VRARGRGVVGARGAFREPGGLARRAPASQTRPTWCASCSGHMEASGRSIDRLAPPVPYRRRIIFEAAIRSKYDRRASKLPLPAVSCAYNVSIYNLEAVEISVCSKHSAGGKWPQPWTAGRRVTAGRMTSEPVLQIHKFCHNRHMCVPPWLWVLMANSFCLSVSHHVPDTLWNRSKACEAWIRSWVRFLPTPPGSQSSLIFCFFFVENSEGSLIKC